MIPLSLGELAAIVGGELHGAEPSVCVTGAVEFDSRRIAPGDLFLALPGERVDGHDFAAAALAAGAVAALATRPVPGPCVIVSDGLDALAALAAAVVRRLPQCTVIGVTGSSGKTSTKDLIAGVLRPAGPTVAPPGSYNNELGHPYTVLKADAATRFLVLEKSARNVGHIRYLTEIAPPRIGAVLNVGSAHLGIFGSREAIAQAKGELVEALPPEGLAVLNADDALVAGMAPRTRARVRFFGESEHAEVRAVDVTLDALGRARFRLVTPAGSAPVSLQLVGRHHVSNSLAAAAVAVECGVAPHQIAATLSATTAASRWRMELTERPDGVVVVNDAYNANPESMRAALETLAALGGERPSGRTWAVLGPMAELGENGPAEHELVGELAARAGVAELVAVGAGANPYAAGYGSTGAAGRARSVPDVAAAVALLDAELRAGDVVLIKASRAAGLERVAAALTDEPGDRTAAR